MPLCSYMLNVLKYWYKHCYNDMVLYVVHFIWLTIWGLDLNWEQILVTLDTLLLQSMLYLWSRSAFAVKWYVRWCVCVFFSNISLTMMTEWFPALLHWLSLIGPMALLKQSSKLYKHTNTFVQLSLWGFTLTCTHFWFLCIILTKTPPK